MLVWIPLLREISIGEVLYHELGHHIHACARPEHREKEDVADDWGRKMEWPVCTKTLLVDRLALRAD